MSAGVVRTPTVLLPSGPRGEAVVARLQAALPLDPRLRVVRAGVHHAAGLGEALEETFGELLRVGGAMSGGPRLDLFALIDLLDPAEPAGGPPPEAAAEPAALLSTVASVLKNRFGGVFPADAPAEQRTASLHLILLTPGLQTASGPRVVAALRAIEAAARDAVHPVLSRVWIAAAQTRAGVWTDEDLVAGVSGFLIALSGSALRDEPAARDRVVHHPPGLGLMGFLSVAALDLPLARLMDYARARAAHDALDLAVERVQAHVADARTALDRHGALQERAWVEPFTDGDPARRLQELAWRLAGGSDLPDVVGVGPFDTAEELRDRFAVLYRPALQPREASQVAADELEAALLTLDVAEADVHQRVHDAVDALLDGRLGTRPLELLPEVEAALTRLRSQLLDGLARDRREEGDLVEIAEEPGLEGLRAATDGLPSPSLLRAVGGALGLGVGFLAAAVTLAATGPSAAAGAALSATVVSTTATAAPEVVPLTAWLPWIVGLGVGGLTAWLGARLAGARSREGVRAALQARREALVALKESGTAADATRRAKARLRAHRLRVRRNAVRAVEATLARLERVRGRILFVRDRLARQLDGLGVRRGADMSRDDLSGLLRDTTPLADHLVGAGTLARWLAAGRRFADPASWTDHVLSATWPRDGLRHDGPAADDAELLTLAAQQLTPLSERSLFDDAAAAAEAAERARVFAQRAVAALAPAAVPRSIHGTEVLGIRRGETLTVAPSAARVVLEQALSRADADLGTLLWTPRSTPQVLIVRTWEGYSADDVARGAGVQPAGGAP